MIKIDLHPGETLAYKKIVEEAQKDGVLKACGNPDQPWIILKLNTEEFLKWLVEKGTV